MIRCDTCRELSRRKVDREYSHVMADAQPNTMRIEKISALGTVRQAILPKPSAAIAFAK